MWSDGVKRHWLDDFHITKGTWVSKKTGIVVKVTPLVVQETLDWLLYFAVFSLFRLAGFYRRAASPKIWFAPERARPWYLVWPTLIAAGARIVDDPKEADLAFQFDDSAVSPEIDVPVGLAGINFGCTDIQKSTVSVAFEKAFGYGLLVDPEGSVGPIVEKSELNGTHDGRIRDAPFVGMPDRVYQRLIDNSAPDGIFEDLRTPTLDGVPLVVFVKRRPEKDRFSNDNTACLLKRPDEVFTALEIASIRQFCAELKMDWGGIDALRDRTDGRLYIVDANKTDMGPPTILPLPDKMRATKVLGDAMADYLAKKERTL
jgi:hypothetical protein